MSLIVKNDLYDYKNRYIYQYKEGFKFSLDSLLLAEFVEHTGFKKKILDMCTGNAVVPLVQTTYGFDQIVGFELQREVALLAEKSVSINKLTDKITIVNDDIKNIYNYYEKESFDVITCNPPYFKVNNKDFINKRDILSIARHEVALKLEEVFDIASKMLKNKGVFYLVHRANRLDEVIVLAHKYNLNVKVLQLLRTKNEEKPTILLVKCIKGSKFGIIINNEISVLNLSTYQHLFRK